MMHCLQMGSNSRHNQQQEQQQVQQQQSLQQHWCAALVSRANSSVMQSSQGCTECRVLPCRLSLSLSLCFSMVIYPSVCVTLVLLCMPFSTPTPA